jgi:hypothetical protein
MSTTQFLAKFFGVAIRGQTYLNLVYLALAFPLGLFYFILLVVGFALGFSLLIIWIGAFILAGMFAAWWTCAGFERQMAIWLLREDIPPMARRPPTGASVWEQVKAHLGNPVTWKSLLFLLAKFPLGIFTFVIMAVLIALTLSFLAAPVAFPFFPMQIVWWGDTITLIDTLWEAIACFFVGVVLLFPTLHILNGLAWVSGRFARLMLGSQTFVQPATQVLAEVAG